MITQKIKILFACDNLQKTIYDTKKIIMVFEKHKYIDIHMKLISCLF